MARWSNHTPAAQLELNHRFISNHRPNRRRRGQVSLALRQGQIPRQQGSQLRMSGGGSFSTRRPGPGCAGYAGCRTQSADSHAVFARQPGSADNSTRSASRCPRLQGWMTCSVARASPAAQMARACPFCGSVDRQALRAADFDDASTSALKRTAGAALQLSIPSSAQQRFFAALQEGRQGSSGTPVMWDRDGLRGRAVRRDEVSRRSWPGGARCKLGASELRLAGTALAVSPSHFTGGRCWIWRGSPTSCATGSASSASWAGLDLLLHCISGSVQAPPSRRATERDEEKIATGRTNNGLQQASAGVRAGRREHLPCRLGEARSDRKYGPLHGASQRSWARRQRNRNRLPGAGGGGAGREGAAGRIRQVVHVRRRRRRVVTLVLFGRDALLTRHGAKSTGCWASPRPRRRSGHPLLAGHVRSPGLNCRAGSGEPQTLRPLQEGRLRR